MITAVDDRTAEAKTFCITSNLLRGALAREHGWGIERSREEAASNPTHVFHFSKGEALENMPENQVARQCAADEVIDALCTRNDIDPTQNVDEQRIDGTISPR